MKLLHSLKITSGLLILLLSTSCLALDLQVAKDKGLVGETPSGYLESPTGKPSAEVIALMADINGKRKLKYQEVAAKVGKSLSIVEQLAGEKALEKTEAGHFVKKASGEWIKK
ncbi:hypothetical protein TDB9533_03501 [Thalassocella blandensis]|nr:hypothetical protein TDB9533_03501 [Thalassocella blandensis]